MWLAVDVENKPVIDDTAVSPTPKLPVIVPPDSGNTVLKNEALSFIAAANSFNVFKLEGAESIRPVTAVSTYAVVAIFVELSDADWVVAVFALDKLPVNTPAEEIRSVVPTVKPFLI